MEAPRFFVADGSAVTLGEPAGRQIAAHLVVHGGARHALVVDGRGALRLSCERDWHALDDDSRRSLHARELTGRPAELLASRVFAFALHHVVARADAPGLNDPVELHGTLYGPFPSAAPCSASGLVTTTRGELLDALLRGAWSPFLASSPAGTAPFTTLTLAADDEAALARGDGLVLALPLEPAPPGAPSGGNEATVRMLLHDVLVALRADAAGEGHEQIAARAIPPLSRATLVRKLAHEGFVVDGDVAVRRGKGWFRKLFPERVALPDTASTDELLALAELALAELPGWPSERALALRRCVRRFEVRWRPGDALGLVPVAPNGFARYSVDDGALVLPRPKQKPKDRSLEERLRASWRALHLVADESFRAHGPRELELDVEVLDEHEHGEITFACNGTREAMQPCEAHPFHRTGAWRQLRFAGGDVALAGAGAGGADVFVLVRALGDVRLRSLVLRDVSGSAAAVERAVPPSSAPAAAAAPPAAKPPARRARRSKRAAGTRSLDVVSWPSTAWTAQHNVKLTPGPSSLTIECTGRDPHLVGPAVDVEGPVVVDVRLRSTGGNVGEIFWATAEHPRHFDAFPAQFDVVHDGAWHDYRVRLYEKGRILVLRFDPGNDAGTVELERFEVVPVLEEPLPAAPANDRVVYFDVRYPAVWNNAAARLAERVEAAGFAIVDGPALAAWMRARSERAAPGSVCVMAADVFPDTVLDTSWDDCTARRYLDAGGRIAWGGDMPFSSRGHSDGSRSFVGGYTIERNLGFRGDAANVPEAPEITDDGRAFGMQRTGKDGVHVVSVGDVDVVLARVGRFYAASWLKTYAPAHPGSGLLRYRNGGLDGLSDDDAADYVRVALHGLPHATTEAVPPRRRARGKGKKRAATRRRSTPA